MHNSLTPNLVFEVEYGQLIGYAVSTNVYLRKL
jgi:hypothetical protein